MDSLRFADVFFIIIVLAVTFGILFLVNQARNRSKPSEDQEDNAVVEDVEKTGSES